MTTDRQPDLTHVAADGTASMVDVSAKPAVAREAVATGTIALAPETLVLIQQNAVKKGDVLAVARVAGIQAAKKTADLIPLCHPLPLARVGVDFAFEAGRLRATATAKTVAPTGVEREALAAVAVALLTVYDMCKAADPSMEIGGIHLVSKTKSPAPHP
jgi:cyclic pyranopterin phosphate synthase